MTLTGEREAPPPILGRYRLGRRLGAGGFGAVHEAVDELLDRRVAVKVIPADGSTPDRARREAMAAARLDHPGVVAIFDAGEEPGARYLVSELVEGRTLAQLEADGELSDRDVMRIGLALCDALGHAHERGVVHRDVKPQNVIVPDRPRTWRGAAKLTDFGVALLAGDEPLTRTGDVVGTLAYMAPEQASGGRVDERVDLYALGLVLYEALAGVNPVRAASPAATARLVGTLLPPLARQRRDLPPALCTALDRAVRPNADERGTLGGLSDALAAALPAMADDGGTVVPHPLERTGLPPLPPAAARALAAAAAAFLTAAALDGLTPAPPVAPPLAGLAAGLGTALLPRAGWLLAVLGAAAALAFADDPRPGSAVLILAAALPVVLLVARPRRELPEEEDARGLAWSVPALAPGLGLLGLAGAYPALAGRARAARVRVALGALGAWWLLLAEPLLEHVLVFGPAPGTPAREAFEGAAGIAAGDVVGAAASSGALALALLWGGAALVLPWLVRGRSAAIDVVTATAWAAGLAAATTALGQWLGDRVAQPEPRAVVAGALVGGVLAVLGARTQHEPAEG